MANAESRRQLLESENVTKITELSLIFVPLSFVASVFSMQIKELQTPASLKSFVLAVIVAVSLAYGVRLFADSKIVGRVTYSSVYHGQCSNQHL